MLGKSTRKARRAAAREVAKEAYKLAKLTKPQKPPNTSLVTYADPHTGNLVSRQPTPQDDYLAARASGQKKTLFAHMRGFHFSNISIEDQEEIVKRADDTAPVWGIYESQEALDKAVSTHYTQMKEDAAKKGGAIHYHESKRRTGFYQKKDA